MLENQYGIYLSLFLGGLIGSIAHCSMMCSPFVLSQMCHDSDEKLLTKLRGAILIPYHLGRISTYAILGFAISFFSSSFLTSHVKNILAPILLCSAGIIFIIMAFPQTKNKLSFSIPFINKVIEKGVNPLLGHKGGTQNYILGLLLGFLPCGLVYAALMLTITLDSFVESAFGMILFGIGTIPILFTIAFIGQMTFSKISFLTGNFRKGLMIFNALNLFMIAGLKIT